MLEENKGDVLVVYRNHLILCHWGLWANNPNHLVIYTTVYKLKDDGQLDPIYLSAGLQFNTIDGYIAHFKGMISSDCVFQPPRVLTAEEVDAWAAGQAPQGSNS